MRNAYLLMVDGDENHNKYYQMTQNNAGTFKVCYGRVGANGMKRRYPLSKWDSIYQSKLKKGYQDKTYLYLSTVYQKYKEIEDEGVRSFWEDVERYSKRVLESNYSISYDKVTPKMIEEATELLLFIQNQSFVKPINDALLDLFQVIPRKMYKVEEYLVKDLSELSGILDREWSLLDVMKGRVQSLAEKTAENNQTILDSLGLTILPVTDEKRIKQIKNHLEEESVSKFSRAFRVYNKKTYDRFYQYMDKNEYKKKDIHYLYDGSRNENWYGLLTKGPMLRPQGVIITGKAFGNGIYFAPRAKKSIGYSSLQGAYRAGGTQNKAYLAVYKVLYKNQKDVNLSYPYDLKNIAPCDAVYAHKGLRLQNDEVIVYREEQITLQYIIELKA